MKRTAALIEAIVSGDAKQMSDALSSDLKERVNNILDVKRVAITADIYDKNNLSEAKVKTMTFGQSISYIKSLSNPECFLKKSSGNGVTYFEYKNAEAAQDAYLKDGEKNGSLQTVIDNQFSK